MAIYANIRIIAFGLDVNFAEAERANQARLVLLAKVLQSGNEIVYRRLDQFNWLPRYLVCSGRPHHQRNSLMFLAMCTRRY